jgi:hypothetical protein
MGYSGAQGILIYEKNLMSKISCQTPFNPEASSDPYLQAGGGLDCASYARPTAPTAQQTLLSSKAEEVLL